MVTEHPPVPPTKVGACVGQQPPLSDVPALDRHGAVCLPDTAPAPVFDSLYAGWREPAAFSRSMR